MKKSTATARRTLRERARAARAARAPHTLASHGRRAGLDAETASSIGGALRSKAKSLGMQAPTARMFRRNDAGQKMWRQPVAGARRYDICAFAVLVAAYKPRARHYVEAKTVLAAYAGI